jgi:hypothetical protein
LNYRQRTGCCPIKALSQLQRIPKAASFLDKNNNVNNDQLKAEKALLLLTGQAESDRLRNWAKDRSSMKPTIKVRKWNFQRKKEQAFKGGASLSNLRPLYPGEENIIRKQLVQR